MTRHAGIPIFVPHVGCPCRCSFCDQHTISGAGRVPGLHEIAALCREGLDHLPEKCSKAEIAFFGGSFTAIPRKTMLELLEAAQPFRDHPAFGGIRVSTRPDAIDREVLEILQDHGVRAIELGAQSMDDGVLSANERGHTARQVAEAARLIRREGFELGLQMMTGLYRSDPEKDWETGARIAELQPDTVRIYPTVVLPGTELARLMEQGFYSPPGLDETVELCAKLLALFEDRDIRVIRLGLPAGEELEKRALGGCFHPALGELCRSRLLLEQIFEELEGVPADAGPMVLVPPEKLSQAIGQRRRNLIKLRERWPGLTIRSGERVGMDHIIIRDIKETEYPLLEDFLYEAIFLPEGVEPPPRSIINSPELQVYIEDFGGRPDDRALVAQTGGKVIGAVWVRMMNDYGHIDDRTPSFAISLYKEYRGRGIGTEMMKRMLAVLKACGYRQASLAVQKANYAVKMYCNVGFEIIDENEKEYIMVKRF